MTGQEITTAVQTLNFPAGSYIVFGSCPMALAGIRESSDIDMLVTPELFADLEKQGWKKLHKAPGDEPLVSGDFEVHARWDFSSHQPSLSQLLATATVVDGVPFTALEEVKKWKQSSGRPKDLVDIGLIDSYLANK